MIDPKRLAEILKQSREDVESGAIWCRLHPVELLELVTAYEAAREFVEARKHGLLRNDREAIRTLVELFPETPHD